MSNMWYAWSVSSFANQFFTYAYTASPIIKGHLGFRLTFIKEDLLTLAINRPVNQSLGGKLRQNIAQNAQFVRVCGRVDNGLNFNRVDQP